MNLLEHVDHVVQVNERVIDGHHIGPLLQGGSQHQTPDAAKSVDSDSSHGSAILKVLEGDNKIFTLGCHRMSLSLLWGARSRSRCVHVTIIRFTPCVPAVGGGRRPVWLQTVMRSVAATRPGRRDQLVKTEAADSVHNYC